MGPPEHEKPQRTTGPALSRRGLMIALAIFISVGTAGVIAYIVLITTALPCVDEDPFENTLAEQLRAPLFILPPVFFGVVALLLASRHHLKIGCATWFISTLILAFAGFWIGEEFCS